MQVKSKASWCFFASSVQNLAATLYHIAGGGGEEGRRVQ